MQAAEPEETLLQQSERKTHTLSFQLSVASLSTLMDVHFFFNLVLVHILIIFGNTNWACSCLQMKPAWLSSTEKRGDYAESGEPAVLE